MENTSNLKSNIEQVIGQTQDGNKIGTDKWGKFIQKLIDANTEDGFVNVDDLESDFRYTLHEFTKALKAIGPLADKFRDNQEAIETQRKEDFSDGTELINAIAKG